MSNHEMLTAVNGPMLAEAFPIENRAAATLAGLDAARRLAPRQWTERFAVQVGGDTVLIPARLHFTSDRPRLADGAEPWLFARALQTRSNDGFERQRALRELAGTLDPWAAPFIVALVGEYVVEILDDVSTAMKPELELTIGSFIFHNRAFWNTIKRRVTSYWNVYYRARWLANRNQAERRDEYVGFRLVQRLESAAGRSAPSV